MCKTEPKTETETETAKNRTKPNQMEPHQIQTEPNKNRAINLVSVWFLNFLKPNENRTEPN